MRRGLVISIEIHDNSIVAIYHKWPENAFNNVKARNQIFKPHGLMSGLKTSNILCLYGRGTCKNPLNNFPRDSSSFHHKDSWKLTFGHPGNQ